MGRKKGVKCRPEPKPHFFEDGKARSAYEARRAVLNSWGAVAGCSPPEPVSRPARQQEG
jgi:hypothetical protein